MDGRQGGPRGGHLGGHAMRGPAPAPVAPEAAEAEVRAFFERNYDQERRRNGAGARTSVPWGILKRCRVFSSGATTYQAMRDWFQARSDQYMIMGQAVYPTFLHQAAAAAAPAPAPPRPPPPARLPAALLHGLTDGAAAAPSFAHLECSICSLRCGSCEQLRHHLRSARHRAAVLGAGAIELERAVMLTTQDPRLNGFRHCELCSRWFTSPALLAAHHASAAHRVKVFHLLVTCGGSLTAPPDPADPLQLSALPDPLPPLLPGGAASHVLRLRNASATAELRLVAVKFIRPPPPDGSMALTDVAGRVGREGQLPAGPSPLVLPPGASYDVVLRLAPLSLGLSHNILLFDLGGVVLGRAVRLSCVSEEMAAEAAEAAAAAAAAGPGQAKAKEAEKGAGGVHRKAKLQPVNTDIVLGVPPAGLQAAEKPLVPVLQLPPPRQLRALLESEGAQAALRRLIPRRELVRGLRQYVDTMANLLWLEELQHEVDVRVYDMKGAQLILAGSSGKLALTVPGLAENRPSVLKGDRLFVRPTGAGSREYEGYVHAVERENVMLQFHASFLNDGIWIANRPFDVRFAVNRSAFNLMHNALRRAAAMLPPPLVLPYEDVRFGMPPYTGYGVEPLPTEEPAGGDACLGLRGPIRWNKAVGANTTSEAELNSEQKLAVREVLRGAHAPLPYIIFGPPGTGKTRTLVEAARQLLSTGLALRLLAVAPSNSAADQLAEKLRLGSEPGVVRLCAYSRPLADLPEPLRELAERKGLSKGRDCAVNWAGPPSLAFLMPPLEVLAGARALVTTCCMAARLFHAGLTPGHFSHILVDEAGHAEEPLLLCALAGLAGPATRVVMAGDPQQLGPIILSDFAKRHGLLDVSLLERLLSMPAGPFARREAAQGQPAPARPYHSAFITKLVHNYRSHPNILRVPNAAFYHGELLAAGSPEMVGACLLWEGLPNNRVPLVMHHIVGKDEQVANSPSWLNVLEAHQVVGYVKRLKESRRCRGLDLNRDVGIISPYKKQVQYIRTRLVADGCAGIKVGSVEEFQGQERKIIIISTVRSSDSFLDFDTRYRLGFLCNPKRFNVAITRAKALCIIVGNAQILAEDPCWRALLRYLQSALPAPAITGQPLPQEVLDRLERAEPEARAEGDRIEEPFVGPWAPAGPGGGFGAANGGGGGMGGFGAANGGGGMGGFGAANGVGGFGAAAGGRQPAAGGGAEEEDPAYLVALGAHFQRLALGRAAGAAAAPAEEDWAAMEVAGALVQVEGGEMRRVD